MDSWTELNDGESPVLSRFGISGLEVGWHLDIATSGSVWNAPDFNNASSIVRPINHSNSSRYIDAQTQSCDSNWQPTRDSSILANKVYSRGDDFGSSASFDDFENDSSVKHDFFDEHVLTHASNSTSRPYLEDDTESEDDIGPLIAALPSEFSPFVAKTSYTAPEVYYTNNIPSTRLEQVQEACFEEDPVTERDLDGYKSSVSYSPSESDMSGEECDIFLEELVEELAAKTAEQFKLRTSVGNISNEAPAYDNIFSTSRPMRDCLAINVPNNKTSQKFCALKGYKGQFEITFPWQYSSLKLASTQARFGERLHPNGVFVNNAFTTDPRSNCEDFTKDNADNDDALWMIFRHADEKSQEAASDAVTALRSRSEENLRREGHRECSMARLEGVAVGKYRYYRGHLTVAEYKEAKMCVCWDRCVCNKLCTVYGDMICPCNKAIIIEEV